VARAVLHEPDLPVAAHDEASRELKLLVDRREDLVGERTRMINRLRWHLHRIVVTQIRFDGPGRADYRKRLETGDSSIEALRCLKRRLARVIYQTLKNTPSIASANLLAAA
jgi:transposase